jgi:hypothetical protein
MARVWSDEDHLEWLRLRSAGRSVLEIAQMFRCHPAYVSACTNRIRTADLSKSGEDRQAVLGAYW